jgi:hypothetical protein
MNANIHRVKSAVFGRCDEWPGLSPTGCKPYRTYHLEVVAGSGEQHDITLFFDDAIAVPTINSEITDQQGKVVGDWLTDSIDGIGLELPPLEDTSVAEPTPLTDKEKLEMALDLVHQVGRSGKTKLGRHFSYLLNDVSSGLQELINDAF